MSNTPFILPDYPPELLNMPGMVGEMQRFIHGRMSYPSKATAGIAAIATMGAFAQTNLTIRSRDGLGFNEYFLILAPTGFGKEDLRRPPEILDKESGDETVLFRHAAPASAQGCHQILEANRSVFFLADEFAEWLKQSRSANNAIQAALGYIMQAYTRATGTIEPGNAVSNDYQPVSNPRLSILATSTAEALMQTLTRDQADSGAYNRWLMFVGDQELPPKVYEGLVYEPSPELVEFIKWLKQQHGEVRFSREGWSAFKRLDNEMAEPIKRDDGLLGGRLSEQAIKIAGLFALADKRFRIEPDDLFIAFDIRVGLYHRAATLARHEGSLDGLHITGQAAKQVEELFRRHDGLYKSQLPTFSRKYRGLSVAERHAVLEHLRDTGVFRADDNRKAYLHSEIRQATEGSSQADMPESARWAK